jgi:translation initiation factor IF-2
MKRPPVVVVMGHVDHGKTTLLDYIRKTNVAAKEAGGITQSIGAYEIEYKGEKITFIDTPGHQAFTNMRRYGAKVADIAILVVAADDGVKPQTREAIQIIKEEKIPFIVAINKVDKSNANPERVKNELFEEGIFLEKYGGDVSWEEISAKTGMGVENVLDLILLIAQVEQLEYDENKNAYGIVIKSSKDERKGIVASVILKDGKIKVGQTIVTQSALGKIKILNNFLGQRIESALPSAPLEIIGFENIPLVGEEFFAGEDLNLEEIRSKIKNKEETKKIDIKEGEDVLKIILKADEYASLEALEEVIIHSFKEDGKLAIIGKSVGNITEGDVKEASAFGAVIVGFKTKVDKAALILAKSHKVEIIESKIIYELEKTIEERLKNKSPQEKRMIKILKCFGVKGKEQIVGGVVTKGYVKNQENFEILRNDKKVGEGRILNLQSGKQDVKEAEEGKEVGLLLEAEEKIKEGDFLVL